MKVSWKLVAKVIGVTAMGASAVMGAIESDEKVQQVIKKVAEKSLESMEKKS